MSKATSVVWVAIGAIVTIAGMDAVASLTSTWSQVFTSWPTGRAIWMLIAGVVIMAIGLMGAWRARNRLE